MLSAEISDGRNELGFHFSVGLLEESQLCLQPVPAQMSGSQGDQAGGASGHGDG